MNMSLESDVNSCIQLLHDARNKLAREPASDHALRRLKGIIEYARTLFVKLQREEKKAGKYHREYIWGADQLGHGAPQADMGNGGAGAIYYAKQVSRLSQKLRSAIQSAEEATQISASTFDAAPTEDTLEGRISLTDSPHLDRLQLQWLDSSWLEKEAENAKKLLGKYSVMREVDESEEKEREMYYYLRTLLNRPKANQYS
jgi:hypothetical protein